MCCNKIVSWKKNKESVLWRLLVSYRPCEVQWFSSCCRTRRRPHPAPPAGCASCRCRPWRTPSSQYLRDRRTPQSRDVPLPAAAASQSDARPWGGMTISKWANERHMATHNTTKTKIIPWSLELFRLTDHPSSGSGVFPERCGRNPPRHLRYFFGRIHLRHDLVLFVHAGRQRSFQGWGKWFVLTTRVLTIHNQVAQQKGSKLEAETSVTTMNAGRVTTKTLNCQKHCPKVHYI